MQKIFLFLLTLFALTAHANSEDYKVIVGYSPGGGTDYITRTIINDAQKESSNNFVVENKPGAAGVIALRFYFENTDKKILGVSGGQVYYEPLFNPENNFLDKLIMLGPVLYSPMALGIAPNSKIKSIDDLFNPKFPKQRVNIATAGSANEMLVQVIKKHSHHDIVGVRFKSSGDAQMALAGSHVDLQSAEYGFFKTKQVPVLAIAGKSVDNVHSLRKYIKDSDIVNFFGLCISKDVKMPEIEKAIRISFVKNNRKEFFESLGYTVDMNDRNDYLIREMLPKYKNFSKIMLE